MKKFKKLLFVFSMLIMVLSMTGCVNEKSSLTINDDDTSVLSYNITLDKDKYDLLSSYGIDTDSLNQHKNTSTATELDNIDALFQEVAAQYVNYGFSVSPIEDTVEIGFKASKTFMSIEELNDAIAKLYANKLSNANFEVTKTKSNFGTEYKCYGTVEYVIDADIDITNPQISEDFTTMIGKENLESSFSVFMPPSTSVSATDGVYVNSILTWKTTGDAEAARDVHVVSKIKNPAAYAIIGIIAVIVLVIVGLFASRYLKKIKDRKNSTDLEDDDPETYATEDDDTFEED